MTPPPSLVLGATDDFLVDRAAVEETARYFGGSAAAATVMVDSPHDVMLGSKWKNAAEAIEVWLQQLLLCLSMDK
jgi:alpha-beta hydrolase superfamily lysophospholipase